ncbi:hypothetical protein KAI19_03730, partial [bacterium]|nr:hypothetical protein [bacterium]
MGKLMQEDKKSIVIKIWSYISTNSLLSALIVALIMVLFIPVIFEKGSETKELRKAIETQNQSINALMSLLKQEKEETQPKSQLAGIDKESIKKALEKEPELRKIAKESDIDKLKEHLFETILSSAEGLFYKGNVYCYDGKFKEAI